MLAYLAYGLALLAILVLLARWFVRVPAHDLAQALRTFVAAFSALASTGLLLTGRLGLAIVTVAATVVAVRALVMGGRPDRGDPAGSSIETRLVAMRLDHATGDVEGRVKAGQFAGAELRDLGLQDLARLLEEARREDPRAVPLLEAYLDRRAPDWRERAGAGEAGAGAAPASGVMDDKTALEILGLAPGATEAEIKAAHRGLMAKLHPDHGGSSYLAGQINRARDHLLKSTGRRKP